MSSVDFEGFLRKQVEMEKAMIDMCGDPAAFVEAVRRLVKAADARFDRWTRETYVELESALADPALAKVRGE